MKRKASCDVNDCHRGDGIYQSFIGGITLLQFVKARAAYCLQNHHCENGCVECDPLIRVAKDILLAGVVDVAATYRKVYPNLKYKSYNAKRRFMQLPVVIFEILGKGHRDWL